MNSLRKVFNNHLIRLVAGLMTILVLATLLVNAQPSQALVNNLLPGIAIHANGSQPPVPLSHEPILPLGSGPKGQTISETTFNTLNSLNTPVTSSLSTSFAGPDFNTNVTNTGGYVFIPPDPIAAAGPDHVVSVVNVTIEWHTKAGVEQHSESLQNFFTSLSPVNFTFDPKVIYDQYEDRFVVITLEKQDTVSVTSSRILVAVSDDSDPNGTWYFHSINSLTNIGGTDTWADYPGFAVDEEAVYITNNMFSFGTNTFQGIRLWIIDKGVVGGFYGGSSASVTVQDPYATSGGIEVTTQPAHIFDTPTAPAASTGTFLVGYSKLTSGGNEFIQVVRLDNPLTAPTFSAAQFVPLGNIDDTAVDMPDAPQSGSTTDIETNDRRTLHAVWRDNELWLTTTVVPGSGVDSGQATAHWVNINTSNLLSLSLNDQGNIGGEDIATGTYTFFPSVAIDPCGNAGFGFAASAATIFPGAYYTNRYASDTIGTVQSSGTLAAGTDYYVRTFGQGRNRWGDYSGMSLDPANQSTFWVFNEYAMTRGTLISGEDGRWATQYGSFPSGIDFGDLSSAYATTFANDGARHCIGVPYLGSEPDPDNDGQESSQADGDGADEDGVTWMTGLSGTSWTEGTVSGGEGGSLNITITGGSGVPQVFIDFGSGLTEVTLRNNTGTPLSMPLSAGTTQVYFDIPGGNLGATVQPPPTRVRLSSSGGLTATGLAADGEVEDYVWSFAPTAVAISGPTTGLISTNYNFEAAVTPLYATTPFTYTWEATEQTPVVVTGSNNLTDTVSFNWPLTGPKTITVTAESSLATVTNVYQIMIDTVSAPEPPTAVSITGPANGQIDTSYDFTADVTPISTTLPLTYTWQATGQSPVVLTNSSSLTDTVSFSWPLTGTQFITVTAVNSAGIVTGTHSIVITETAVIVEPPTAVTITGLLTGTVGTDYQFEAAVSPLTATLPLTYTWQTAGQAPVIHVTSNVTDTVTFNWDTAGDKVVAVTVENSAGAVNDSHPIAIKYLVYLPAILRQ